MRARAASASPASSLPFSTARASCFSIRPRPLASVASSTSRSTTSQPACAATCAIPWPISPAPSTPTFSIIGLPGPCAAGRLLGRANLDGAAADARLEPRLRVRGRAPLHRAVLEPEAAAVPRAGDAAVGDLPVCERAAAVRAAVRERVQPPARADEHHRELADEHAPRPAVLELALVERTRPLAGVLVEHGRVDAHALRVG